MKTNFKWEMLPCIPQVSVIKEWLRSRKGSRRGQTLDGRRGEGDKRRFCFPSYTFGPSLCRLLKDKDQVNEC